MKDLQGRVAVVTGGASGIGLALGRAAAAEGMAVVLADVEEAALRNAEAALRADGASVVGIQVDVGRADAVEALAERSYSEMGAVHLLCSNAGVIAGRGPIWECALDDWRWLSDVNLFGLVHTLHAFVPRMIEAGQQGHVLVTASITGLLSGPGLGIYKATKHAAISISETLYHDLRQYGAPLGVSVVCPGGVRTALQTAERNRPADLANSTNGGRVRNAAPNAARSELLDPEEVAAIAIDAVRADRFYVLTHRSGDAAVDQRLEDVRLRRNPEDFRHG